jgi:hypothetical protein
VCKTGSRVSLVGRNSGPDKTKPFLALNMALATFVLSQKLVNYRSSILFSRRIRAFLSDFGPALTIMCVWSG